jgi:hypothetical protein
MPSEDGIHCKEKNKALLIRTMDSDLRRNDFSVLVMPVKTSIWFYRSDKFDLKDFQVLLLSSNPKKA